MKRQYPNKSHWVANRLRTRRRQLCIKWRIDARGMSFHIRWTSKRKSAILQKMVLRLFDYRLMQHYKFSIGFKWEFLLCHAIQNFHDARRSRSLVFAVRRALPHRAWTWLVLQRVIVKVWHSLSVDDPVKIPTSSHDWPGSRQMAVCIWKSHNTMGEESA